MGSKLWKSEAQDQPDVNGIPLAAIERIEVLPASAAAIYGGGAVGGVVNIIMRRDYVGTEISARYDIDTRGDAPNRVINFVTGFNLEEGRTQVLISGQYRDQDPLKVKERNFRQRGRAQQLANNPTVIYGNGAGTAGNPPAGAQVNIRSADGSPLFGPGSSYFTTVPIGYRGWQLDGLDPLKANQGTYSLGLGDGTLGNFSGEEFLYQEIESKSINVSLRRAMTDRLEIFAEYAHDEQSSFGPTTYFPYYIGSGVATLSADSPNNPFGKAIKVTFPTRIDDRDFPGYISNLKGDRAAIGAAYRLGGWQLTADFSWSRNKNTTRYARDIRLPGVAFGQPLNEAIEQGLIDVLRDTTSFATDVDQFGLVAPAITESVLKDTTLRASGPLIKNWYAGPIRLAFGLERRKLRNESIQDTDKSWDLTGLPPEPTVRGQRTDSAYVEANIPLASPEQKIPGIYSFEIQLAGRHEKYKVNTGTSNTEYNVTMPTVGLRYEPFRQLMLRGSFSKGFTPPSYSQLTTPTLSTSPTTINDPRRGGEASTVFTLGGGNPDLTPEKSENWNFGAVFTPDFIPNLRLSVDYYKVTKSNNIQSSISAQQLLDMEADFPDRVIRNPVGPGDTYGVGTISQLYTGAINLAKLETAGYDISLGYRLDTQSAGSFDLNLTASHAQYYRTQATKSAAVIENVDIPSRFSSGTPIDWRGTVALTWTRKAWSAGWFTEFYDSYHIDPNSTTALKEQGKATVDSQMYHDAFIRWSSPGRGLENPFSGLQITLGVKNIFDKTPALDMSRTSNFYSTYGDPRMRRVYLDVRKAF